jgi:hypothetical protein
VTSLSTTCTYEKKNETSFVGKNINNVIINSNVDAIKNDEGRRYFILDLSNEKKGDVKFWDKIYECMNDEVGEAFFSFLHTIDLTDYHDQAFPSTKAKQDAIVKRLDTVARFIKEKYILRNRDLITKLQDLYDEYKKYCIGAGIRTECKIEFNTKLSRYKLEGKKSGNDHNKFNYKLEYLKEIAHFNKWMHATDQYELTEDQFDDLDNNIEDKSDGKNEEIKFLKTQLEAMKNMIKELEAPKEIVVEKVDPIQMMISELLDQQKEVNKMVAKKKAIPKKKKTDPSKFELFLNDLDDLCN